MKGVIALIALVFSMTILFPVTAGAVTWKGQKFQTITYYEYGGKGSMSGGDAGNAKAISDGDVMAIEAGTIIEKVYMVIDTAIEGTTALEVGDDDASDGFISNSFVTLATPGLYGWNAKEVGSYLQMGAAGEAGSSTEYAVPNVKYYSAAGKEVKLNVTTANTAGKFKVIVEGYKL